MNYSGPPDEIPFVTPRSDRANYLLHFTRTKFDPRRPKVSKLDFPRHTVRVVRIGALRARVLLSSGRCDNLGPLKAAEPKSRPRTPTCTVHVEMNSISRTFINKSNAHVVVFYICDEMILGCLQHWFVSGSFTTPNRELHHRSNSTPQAG
ncbi:unnamed protein product [Nesidiocoris tenuis]|uniref:Uncharacterized protein n=1 Tax=Nesidiocoris tenuis TaxID=355587 RepID=A0A6H5HI42_9HEMI|nr:unnamed protein product [Nesidiocoris tenuis]